MSMRAADMNNFRVACLKSVSPARCLDRTWTSSMDDVDVIYHARLFISDPSLQQDLGEIPRSLGLELYRYQTVFLHNEYCCFVGSCNITTMTRVYSDLDFFTVSLQTAAHSKLLLAIIDIIPLYFHFIMYFLHFCHLSIVTVLLVTLVCADIITVVHFFR